MRNYTTQHVPGAHLNSSQRQTLASDWNALVNAGCRITLRQFAAKHGLRYETWRREYLRGATGIAVPDPKDRRRRRYAEYDPFKAQDAINENNANKGTRMLVTNQMAFLFKRHVTDEKLSPYDALCHMKEEMPGQDLPCLSTWYKHINAGDVGVRYGETPYHPSKRPKGPKPHPASYEPPPFPHCRASGSVLQCPQSVQGGCGAENEKVVENGKERFLYGRRMTWKRRQLKNS